MRIVSVEAALENARKYLANDVATPFIIVVDDRTEYEKIVSGLSELERMRVSDCSAYDAYPDIDALWGNFPSSDSATARNILLLGFGESVSVSGNVNALAKLKDKDLPLKVKVVAVCRGIRAAVNSLCADDKKFDSRRVCFLKSGSSYQIVKIPDTLNWPAKDGFKSLLVCLEDGASDSLYVKTALTLHNIKEVGSPYEAIRQHEVAFTVPRTCLPETLWEEFLTDKNLDGYDLFHWRTFLKLKRESAKNAYLTYVVDSASDYNVYKKRIFNALLDFSISDKAFTELYSVRKNLLKDVKDSDIAEYIAETKVKDHDRIYYLTDNTAAERQAMIESMEGMPVIPAAIKELYSALDDYLHDYVFTGDTGELLTEYFSEYKRLKLTNRLTPEFHEQVRNLAIDGNRPYNSLKARGEVLDSLEHANTTLYWIDSLGAEYIGYIQNRAKALGLRITIHVVRSNLPTITSCNSDFYDSWKGMKAQTKKLDDIKHHGEQNFNYQTIKTPRHLAEELRILDTALEWVKAELAGKNANKVILISDHGASRLAVINEQECKWEMLSKGEHSGRCCPCHETDVKSEYATSENGFWILANYDRFKGGRKASVEVHGGAAMEEVVIPLFEIALFDSKIDITNTTPVTTASFKKDAEIVLFSTSKLQTVSVTVRGRQYFAEPIGNNKHRIIFPDIKQAGKYTADVLDGDNFIQQVEFEVQRESGKSNDSDWF